MIHSDRICEEVPLSRRVSNGGGVYATFFCPTCYRQRRILNNQLAKGPMLCNGDKFVLPWHQKVGQALASAVANAGASVKYP